MQTPSRKNTRFPNRLSPMFMVWIILCSIVIASGGVTVAIFKSRQVAVRTEIEKLRRDITVCNINADQYRSKANAQTNLWAMRDRLSQDGSTLRNIEREQIEMARSTGGRGFAYTPSR